MLNFTTTAVTLTIIVYTSETLDFSEWHTGLVLSSAGVGNLVGVFLLNKLNHLPWRFLYAGLMAVSSLGLLVILNTNELFLIMLGMFLFDGALSMAFVVNGSARQAVTPDHFLARISSGGILISGVVGISGNLFAGGIAESISPYISLAICAFLLAFASILSFLFKEGNQMLQKLEPIELGKKSN